MRAGHVRIAEAVLDTRIGPESLSRCNSQGMTPLALATQEGTNEGMVRLLLERGADPKQASDPEVRACGCVRWRLRGRGVTLAWRNSPIR